MNEVKNLGVITKIYSSGMVESDKGFRFPCRAQVGDVMIQDGSTIKTVTKEEFRAMNKSKTKTKVKKESRELFDEKA